MDKLLNMREASKVLGISYYTLRSWVYKKQIKFLKTHTGRYMFKEKDLKEYVEEWEHAYDKKN